MVGNSEPWIRAGFERLVYRCGNNLSCKEENDAFYDGTFKLIRQLAKPYWDKNPNWYSIDELCQLCYTRVWEVLHQYNPERAAISTWLYHVCMSVLNKEYNSSKLNKSRVFVPQDKKDNNDSYSQNGLENISSFSENNLLKIRMQEAISSLFEKNKDRSDILIEIFGNPLITEYHPPNEIPSMTDVMRNLEPKYKYADIYCFYKNTVQPFFKDAFSDYV